MSRRHGPAAPAPGGGRMREDAGAPRRRSAFAARTKKVVRKSCGACRQAGLRWLIHQELQRDERRR